jgi:hypothetical protein
VQVLVGLLLLNWRDLGSTSQRTFISVDIVILADLENSREGLQPEELGRVEGMRNCHLHMSESYLVGELVIVVFVCRYRQRDRIRLHEEGLR